jgi:hypothetical protein
MFCDPLPNGCQITSAIGINDNDHRTSSAAAAVVVARDALTSKATAATSI